MLNLQRVTMFIAVVDAGSFTLAAAALGQTKAVVSFNVRQLENELGVTLLMVTFGHLTVLAGLLVALWGFAFGLVPVAWSTWLATTVPDEAESAGGLLVASIQLAISAGAAGGGAVFDLHGASGVFTGSGLLLLSAMVIVFAAVRVKPVARADQPVTGRLSREIDN